MNGKLIHVTQGRRTGPSRSSSVAPPPVLGSSAEDMHNVFAAVSFRSSGHEIVQVFQLIKEGLLVEKLDYFRDAVGDGDQSYALRCDDRGFRSNSQSKSNTGNRWTDTSLFRRRGSCL